MAVRRGGHVVFHSHLLLALAAVAIERIKQESLFAWVKGEFAPDLCYVSWESLRALLRL